jgi:hypothetical protein
LHILVIVVIDFLVTIASIAAKFHVPCGHRGSGVIGKAVEI